MSGVAADDRPTDAAPVALAIGFGIDQKTGDGVHAQDFKERLRRAIAGGNWRADGAADFLIRLRPAIPELASCCSGSSGGKSSDAGKKFADALLQFRQAFAIGFLIVGGKGDQGAIDEIDDAGFACAGSAVAGNNAGGKGLRLPWLRRE